MKLVKLVEDYRNGVLENEHYGQICIVDQSGEITHELGDATTTTFLRSAAKPFQAIPVYMHESDKQFHVTDKEATIFMASQRGESYHEEVLLSLKEKLQINEDVFICGESYPLNDAPKEKYIYDHKEKRKLMHNCAGKHLGILALTKTLGAPLETYGELDGPAQQLSLESMAYMAQFPKKEIQFGVDGCGFPVYAMPLKNIANAYMRLANPELLDDEKYASAVSRAGKLMNAHPEMIASHDFVCTVLLNDPNLVAKGGAKGVYGIGLRDEKIGIALKVMDGSEDVWPQIIAKILEDLDYKNKATIEALNELSPKQLTNDGNLIVGERKTVFNI